MLEEKWKIIILQLQSVKVDYTLVCKGVTIPESELVFLL